MAKTFYVSPGRAYVVAAASGTKITTKDGTTLETVPSNAKFVILSVSVNEIIVNDDNAKVQQMYSAAAGGSTSSSSGGTEGPSIRFEVVQTLPATGEDGIIYLKPTGDTGDNKYEEWVWVNGEYEQMGSAKLDLDGYAVLSGGNEFSGDQEITGNVHVAGSLTIDGEGSINSGNTAYEIAETADSTITPSAGTWTRYTGSETALTIEEPAWTGEVEISYLETASPVTLAGVKWSPAAPILTGDGPFVYTLVHSREGEILAGAYGYSTPTAEAIQKVVPIAWGDYYGYAPSATGAYSISIGGYAKDNGWGRNVSIGTGASSWKPTCVTIGADFTDTAGSYKCQTQGTGSITIGAGASTLNNGDTESSNSITIGCKALNQGVDSVVIGASAKNDRVATVVIGCGAINGTTNNGGDSNVVIGCNAVNHYSQGVAIGTQAKAEVNGVSLGFYAIGRYYCTLLGSQTSSEANNCIAVGYKSSITNTTASNGTVTPSDNTTVIGSNATASAPNTVVMGAGASGTKEKSVSIGVNAKTLDGSTVALGFEARGGGAGVSAGASSNSGYQGTSVGTSTNSSAYGVAVGAGANAGALFATAIGYHAASSDTGSVVLSSYPGDDVGIKTQLYFCGASTPLANEYYNGEAFMGYVVTGPGGTKLACGTRRMSELFPDNSLTQPASLDENGEWVQPKVFHPSDLDLPVEEPTEEPEDVIINIPEPEMSEYTPLPVYPIVEPEIPTEEQ